MTFELAIRTEEIFESKDLSTSFESVFESYAKDLEGIKNIARFVSDKTGLINYFTSGNDYKSFMSSELFKEDGAIAALNADYWSRVINMTDVINCMPANKRNEWSEMIHERKTPSFDRDTVVATIGYLLTSRGVFFADKVDGIFKNLSGKHVTNSPMAFKERMIIDYVLDRYGYTDYRRVEYIHDLRCVIAQIKGQNQPQHYLTSSSLSEIARNKQFGEWFEFDGGSFKIKLFKIGTAHVEIHPEIAQKLNRILATKYPETIPADSRTTVKQPKIRPLSNTSVSFEAASYLLELNRKRHKENSAYCNLNELPKNVRKEVLEVVSFLGGSYSNSKISFKSWPANAISMIVRTCSLPDVKSHQYYPTKEELAQVMVDLAEIQDTDTILEPSAGQGGIADHLPKEKLTCVEINDVNCQVLADKGYEVVRLDFLKYDPSSAFNKIVMNPPFSDNRANEHTVKAYDHLAVNGILVACLPASLKGKELIKGVKHEWSETYEDSFDNTSVRVVLLKLVKHS